MSPKRLHLSRSLEMITPECKRSGIILTFDRDLNLFMADQRDREDFLLYANAIRWRHLEFSSSWILLFNCLERRLYSGLRWSNFPDRIFFLTSCLREIRERMWGGKDLRQFLRGMISGMFLCADERRLLIRKALSSFTERTIDSDGEVCKSLAKLTQLALLKQKETEFLLIPDLGGLKVKEATTEEWSLLWSRWVFWDFLRLPI